MEPRLKLISIVFSILAITAAMFAGCGQRTGAPSMQTGQAGKPRVALIMKSLANEFFQTMENGAREHQRAHPEAYELVANGTKDELDIGRQVDLVEQMIADRVDAIVIAPADSKALVPVCKRALDAGIVVVNIDNKFDAGVLADKNVKIPFVGPDNRKGAKQVGDYLGARLRPGDKVAVIEGAPTAFNSIQRKLGFEEAMKAAGAQIVSSQSASWETSKANQVAAALITEYPDLRAILCANDSMALGAVAALKESGKADQIYVVGFDNISAIRRLVMNGKVLATADQHGDQLAAYGIDYALEMLGKKRAPADRETPVDLITK
jgi:ribose transport system substrate-binding protein